jgi:hypothetical protein
VDTLVAKSTTPSPRLAANELREQLAAVAPTLVLYFASPCFEPTELAAAMSSAFAPAVTIGCTTAGEIISGAMLKRSVVAMALGSETVSEVAVEIAPGLRSGIRGVQAALDGLSRRVGAPLRALDPDLYAGIVLFDGLAGAEERAMDEIGNRTDVLFVGGSAGDDLAFARTHVLACGEAHTDAALLAVVKAPRGFGILKTQSFEPESRTLVATRVREDERTLVELDGRPASEAYAEALGVPVGELAGQMGSQPLGVMVGDDPFVRSPQRVIGNTIKMYCSVREGTELRVLKSTDIVTHTRNALSAKRRELGGGAGISACITFNCILRALELEKRGELDLYGRLFSDMPTIGFNTYGEAYIGHINQTATMLMFR